MGCGASSSAAAPEDAYTSEWAALKVRIRWSGYDGSSPTLTLQVMGDDGQTLLVLRGGVDNNAAEFWRGVPKPASFGATSSGLPFSGHVHRVGSGKKASKERIISDNSGTQLFARSGPAPWRRVGETDRTLPEGLSLKTRGANLCIFKRGAHEVVDEDHPISMTVQQPDGTTELATRGKTPFDNLIATVAVHGTRPIQENGREDMSGDRDYALRVMPELLTALDERARCLLLAMCVEPFWSRATECYGYSAFKPGGHAAA